MMATEKRLIDADALGRFSFHIECEEDGETFERCVVDWEDIEDAPTVEAVEVVRCKECKHSKQPGYVTLHYGLPGTLTCTSRNSPCNNRHVLGEGYCPYGERKDNDI